jgi:hypothetical protein
MRIRFVLPLFLLCLPLASAQEVPSDPPVVSMGMASLYNLDRVTVVYPAGTGEDRERNRRSALRRARLLGSTHGIETRVVADGEIRDEDLQDNLLVLGWNNRLFGGIRPMAPFRCNEGRFKFLGLEESMEDTDLVFLNESPFNTERVLVFWSRIDPELDRARLLPSLGSDWAIYRGYRALAQGMFKRGTSWPPARNENAEFDRRPLIAERNVGLRKHSSTHYDILYERDTLTRDEVEEIAAAREAALAKAAEYVGEIPEGFRITLTVYRDTADKMEWTDVKGPVHSVCRTGEMHMTPRYARTPNAHEEIHFLARERIGPCFYTAIYEGLSFSYERTIRGQDLDVHGAMLLENGSLPSLADLLDEEVLRSLPPEVAFPASGLMMSWLRSRTGPGEFREIYTLEEADTATLGGILGTSAGKLEEQFLAFVRDGARRRAADASYLAALAEASERHLAGDYPGIAAALKKALQSRPGDPEALFNLAAAQMRTGEYDPCEENLLALLGSSLPDHHRLVVFGHYQLGRLYDIQGRREEALQQYRRVLELPDLHNSHRSAREGIETPFTLDRLD